MKAIVALSLIACTAGTDVQYSAGSLSLHVPEFAHVDQHLEIDATGLRSGEAVTLVASKHGVGAGPCLEALDGCLGVVAPFQVVGVAMADELGRATWSLQTPPGNIAGATVGLQAWVVSPDGTRSSRAAEIRIVGDDTDGDGSPFGVDCDDRDASVYPGAVERCDGIDNDCDPATTEKGKVVVGRAQFDDLASAVRGASDGATIELCEGTYEADDLRVDTSLTLRGVGPSTTLRAPDGAPWPALFVDGPAGGSLTLEDLTIVGNGQPFSRGVESSHAQVSLYRVQFERVSGVAMSVNGGQLSAAYLSMTHNGIGLWVEDAQLSLTRSTLTHNHKAIRLDAGRADLTHTVLQRNAFAIDLGHDAWMSMESSDVIENGSGCGGTVCLAQASRLSVVESDFGENERDNRGHDIHLDATSGTDVGRFGQRVSFTCEVTPDGHGSCADVETPSTIKSSSPLVRQGVWARSAVMP